MRAVWYSSDIGSAGDAIWHCVVCCNNVYPVAGFGENSAHFPVIYIITSTTGTQTLPERLTYPTESFPRLYSSPNYVSSALVGSCQVSE